MERADLKTRFSSDNQPARNGKGQGTRDKLSRAFLTDLLDIYHEHGKPALEYLAKNEPGTFVKVVASLQPKEVEIKTPEGALTDEQLEQLYEALLSRMPSPEPETPKTVN